jgi:N-acyl-L-homoserine lactone synthetase
MEILDQQGVYNMIVKIEQYNAHKYSELMDQMFSMRARVFRDRLGWDVQVTEGKERDKYDDAGPVYILYTDENAREVKGSLRLLPTTGPTLLSDIFFDTLPAAVHLSAPTIWECTRLCLDDRLLIGGNREELLLTSTTLLAALGEVALGAGIEMIIGNFDDAMLRLYRQIGCEVEVLGSTLRYGCPTYLGSARISERTVRKINRRLEDLQSARLGPANRSVLAA